MASSSSISSNYLELVLQAPQREGRYFSEISLAGNTSCSYPGPHFSKEVVSVPSCFDQFRGSFSIPEVSSCGFVDSSESGFQTLEGRVHVAAVDPIGQFRGSDLVRTTVTSLGIRLKFPDSVTLETGNLTIAAPIDLLAAVSYQEYNSQTDTLSFTLTTSVQWPYVLLNSSIGGAQPPELLLSDVQCASDTGDCLQETSFSISNIAGSRLCQVQASFDFQWNYQCRGGGNCPVDGSDQISVQANITLEDVCPVFEVESSLSGTLGAYTDSTFSSPSMAFLANEDVYLKASFSSDVTLLSVQVNALTVNPGGRVVAAGGIPLDGLPFVGSYGLSLPEVGFSFGAVFGESPAPFNPADGDVQTFTVEVLFDVSYVTSFRKRDVMTESLKLSKTLVLDASKA